MESFWNMKDKYDIDKIDPTEKVNDVSHIIISLYKGNQNYICSTSKIEDNHRTKCVKRKNYR